MKKILIIETILLVVLIFASFFVYSVFVPKELNYDKHLNSIEKFLSIIENEELIYENISGEKISETNKKLSANSIINYADFYYNNKKQLRKIYVLNDGDIKTSYEIFYINKFVYIKYMYDCASDNPYEYEYIVKKDVCYEIDREDKKIKISNDYIVEMKNLLFQITQ